MDPQDKEDGTVQDASSSEGSPSNSQSLLDNNRQSSSPLKSKKKPDVSESGSSTVVIDIEEYSEEEEQVLKPEKSVIENEDSNLTDFEENEAVPCLPSEMGIDSQCDDDGESDPKEKEMDMSESGLVQGKKNLDDKVQASVRSINEINKAEFRQLKRYTPGDKIFPGVKLSSFHTIAVTLVDGFKPGDSFIPDPKTFQPTWDVDYVPMPCCSENVRVMKRRVRESAESTDSSQLPPKPVYTEVTEILWDKIHSALSEPMLSCEDIVSAIKSYCRQLRGTELNVLKHTLEKVMTSVECTKFFQTVLPGMIQLCLALPEIVTRPLPFLVRFKNHSITLSQHQIASILANAFFCTFPPRFEYEEEFPTINFVDLLTDDNSAKTISKAQKLRCIFHYFERVTDEMPSGLVTFTRKSIHQSKAPDWGTLDKKITKLITLDEGSIEADGERLLQVDFANRYVGGGVLSRGCVQEEILFVIYPELIVSRLFTEKLTNREALLITGCERFSRYRGYANNFEFVGDFIDCTPWNSQGRKCTQIVAMDALYVSKHAEQFHPLKLTRELNKAYVGFSYPPGHGTNVSVATGKWGCGAFKGDAYLKAIVQLLAASCVDRHVVFFTFGDTRLQQELENIYAAIKDKTIGQVWSLLNQYNKLFCTRLNPKINLYEFITEYTAAEDAMQFEDMETDFPDIPPSNFYRDENASSSKKQVDDDENPKKKSPRKDNEKVVEVQPFVGNNDGLEDDKNEPLTDDQICALLESPMEEDEMLTLAESPVERKKGSSNSSKKSTIPFLKNDASPSNNKPLLFPKRTSLLAMDTSKSPSSSSKSNIPNNKRQMTLQDFYAPL